MKRKLAKEALYHSDHFDQTILSNNPRHISAMEKIGRKQIEEIDPHGDRALALLKEFEKPQ